MPNVSEPATSFRVVVHPEDLTRVGEVIHRALDKGDGVAVLPVRDLLLDPADEIHLVGDHYEAGPVLNGIAYAVGYAGARLWPSLPPFADRPVILMRAATATQEDHPLTALMQAISGFLVAPGAEMDARAEDVAAMVRSLAPRGRRKPRTT